MPKNVGRCCSRKKCESIDAGSGFTGDHDLVLCLILTSHTANHVLSTPRLRGGQRLRRLCAIHTQPGTRSGAYIEVSFLRKGAGAWEESRDHYAAMAPNRERHGDVMAISLDDEAHPLCWAARGSK